jgi:hypothetical protein
MMDMRQSNTLYCYCGCSKSPDRLPVPAVSSYGGLGLKDCWKVNANE